jgi:hypothetical protein
MLILMSCHDVTCIMPWKESGSYRFASGAQKSKRSLAVIGVTDMPNEGRADDQ